MSIPINNGRKLQSVEETTASLNPDMYKEGMYNPLPDISNCLEVDIMKSAHKSADTNLD